MHSSITKVLAIFGFLVWSHVATAESVSASQWQLPLKAAQASTSLSHYKGQVIWLDFWASWCPPCRASFPWMNEMQKRYGAKGFRVVAINVDENSQDAFRFLKGRDVGFDVYFDSQGIAPAAFQIAGMPTSLLIDRQGRILMTHIGFESSQSDELESRIAKTLQ